MSIHLLWRDKNTFVGCQSRCENIVGIDVAEAIENHLV